MSEENEDLERKERDKKRKAKRKREELLQSKGNGMHRTSAGLRNVLFDEIDSLRAGDSNPARARSLAMLANTALKSVEVEIEFQKYVSDVSKHTGAAKLGLLELGTEVQMGGLDDDPEEENEDLEEEEA